MVVSIVGWYGTETLGDRAILDGILTVLNEFEYIDQVYIGSLYPFFTERTLYEEQETFRENAPRINIKIFDIRKQDEAKERVAESEIVLMGGGPLMDLEEMFLIRNCFRFAKKKGIRTIIFGCGVGPLRYEKYKTVFKEIISLSDAIWLRDDISLEQLTQICGDDNKAVVLGDPAIISAEQYLKKHSDILHQECKSLTINFREYPAREYGNDRALTVQQCREIVDYIEKYYDQIYLVPMHTFAIGGDDRLFLNQIIWKQNYNKVKIVNEPLNLIRLYGMFRDADGCIGMRYHSILLQTVLNGNNLIIDYTDPKTGKIEGFIDWIDAQEFYRDRRWRLGEKIVREYLDKLVDGRKYEYQWGGNKEKYVKYFKKCLE